MGRRIHLLDKVLKLALQKAAPEMSHNFKDYRQKVCKIENFIALQIFINHKTLIWDCFSAANRDKIYKSYSEEKPNGIAYTHKNS